MSGVEILMIVAIVLQIVAAIVALLLINKTKYRSIWIFCIIGLSALSLERVLQLLIFDGFYVSDMVLAWAGIIVSICFSLGVVFSNFLVRHVDRMALQRSVLENRLMTAVLRTEERSRATFSRELHDGLGPLLSSAKMSLSALSKAELKERDKQMLLNTMSVIDEAIRSLREISNNLSPQILNNFGLVRGIKHFIDRVGAMHKVSIRLDTRLREERFDSNVEVILYRVVCELINNSLKHSKCSDIVIRLNLQGETLIMEYSDNGCGFTASEVMNYGMGLSNMSSRISSLRGTFDIDSKPGEGMRAYIKVNIDSAISCLGGSEYELINSIDNGRQKN